MKYDNGNPKAQKSQKEGRIFTISVAVIVIIFWLPLLDTFYHFAASRGENKTKVSPPALSPDPDSVAKFPRDFEKFHDENFGFRNQLVKLNSIVKVKCLSVSTDDEVSIGKDGWLFNGISRNRKKLSLNDFSARRQSIMKINDWFRSRGIEQYTVDFPQKEIIYPEYLPEYMTKITPIEILQILDFYENDTALDNWVDLRKPLFSAKKDGQVFYKSDHHWNHMGGYAGYFAIMGKMNKKHPELKPLTRDEVSVVENGKFSGRLAVLISLPEYYAENKYSIVPKKPKATVKFNIYNNSWGPNRTDISMCKRCGNKTAVVLLNSQIEYIVPLLSEHFRNATYIVYYTCDDLYRELEKINANRPDMVIVQDHPWNYLKCKLPEGEGNPQRFRPRSSKSLRGFECVSFFEPAVDKIA